MPVEKVVEVKIDGKVFQALEGENLLKFCLENGFKIPYLCYHPGLSPDGCCRMCLVKVSTSRKLEPACLQKCIDKLEVETDNPEIQRFRDSVLEFMLINHPLDCPVCDKAGECLLQDYVFAHRKGYSRFFDQKTKRHIKDLGPEIKLWGTRCILCRRCIRFCREVSGSQQLCIINRADHSVVDTFPVKEFDDPLSLNVVELCPTGAMIDKEFLYQARVWFTRSVDSICPACSRGCNIRVQVFDNKIVRIKARYNKDINRYWLCNAGRRSFKITYAPERNFTQKGSIEELATKIRRAGKKMTGIISSYSSCEEMFLFKKLMEFAGIKRVFIINLKDGQRLTFADGFVIEDDKTPNNYYAKAIFGEEAFLPPQNVEAAFVFNLLPGFRNFEMLKNAQFLAVIDIFKNDLYDRADFYFAGRSFFEKTGTYVNSQGMVQMARACVESVITPEIKLLQGLLIRLGDWKRILSEEEIFKMAFGEINYSRLPCFMK
jgi:NADH-quinone oxidoreductase subunit G